MPAALKRILEGEREGSLARSIRREVFQDFNVNGLVLEQETLIVLVAEIGVSLKFPIDRSREELVQTLSLKVDIGRVSEKRLSGRQAAHFSEDCASIGRLGAKSCFHTQRGREGRSKRKTVIVLPIRIVAALRNSGEG